MFGVKPDPEFESELPAYVASLIGAFLVLVVGSIWRKRKLQQFEDPSVS